MSREMKLRLRSAATVLVILAMMFAFAISGVRLLGIQVYGVLTGSMEPSYPTGSLVYVKAVDPATIKVSDVITFNMSRNVVVTHRVVEKVPDADNPYSFSFRTKGDANEHVDNALVRQSSIIGKVVFSLPMMGHIVSYIQNPPGTYVAILVSLILIAFVFLTDSVDEKAEEAKGAKRPLLPPSVHERLDGLLERYLPFLRKREEKEINPLRQGYTPGQQSAPQQYQPYPQQAQPVPQQFGGSYPQYQPAPQQYRPYPQQQAQYPVQQPAPQASPYQYPQQQQYQPYRQQQVQYPVQQPAPQNLPYQYPRQQYQPYAQPSTRQVPPQHQQMQRPQQPYPQPYPPQSPGDQLQPGEYRPQQRQPRSARRAQSDAGYRR